MMDPVIIGGVLVGLLMGSLGYVLVRFGARPIVGYRRLKRRLANLLAATPPGNGLTHEGREALRRMAVELQELVDEVLPNWYALALHKKGERPSEAVRHLQALANCREPEAVRRRVAKVQESLGLPGDESLSPARPVSI